MLIEKKSNLVRGLGIAGLSAAIFNCTVGGGIFRLPGTVFALTKTWTPAVYLTCGFLMVLVGLCFVLVGRQTLETGGPYAYAKQAFGSFTGYLAGILLWMLGTFSTASVTDALLSSLATMFPAVQDFKVRAMLILLTLGALVFVNTKGIKRGSIALTAFTILKLLALFTLIVFGLAHFHTENVVIQHPFESATFARTCMMLIFAYMGIESALVPGGEIKNPNRTIPIATVVSMVGVTIVYFLIQLVCQSVLGSSLVDHADAPLVYAAEVLLGKPGKVILLTGSVLSMLGFIMGMMLAIPRVIYVLGKDGFLPSALTRVDEKFHVPSAAIIVQGAIVAGFAISGSFNSLAIFANLSTVLLYILCIFASAKIYFYDGQYRQKPMLYNAGISIMMLVSVGIMFFFLTSIQAKEWAAMGILCTVFSLIYVANLRKNLKDKPCMP